jgi:allantoicase
MHLPNLYLHLRYSIVLGDGGEEKDGWDADTKKKINYKTVIILITNAGKVAFCSELFKTLHFQCLHARTHARTHARAHTHTHTCIGNCVLHEIKHGQVGTKVN